MEASTFMASCEERFGRLADLAGFCDVCPIRFDLLALLGEETALEGVPEAYKELGRRARIGCARSKQIEAGESPTAGVNPQDCLAVGMD